MRIVLILIFIVPALLLAGAYRYVDPKTGETVFTDKPPANQNAKPIKLKAPTISKPYPVSPREASVETLSDSNKSEATSDSQKTEAMAFSLRIVSPENQETLRANDGNVTVTAESNRPLGGKKGFLIRFILDGKPVSVSPSFSSTLTNLSRGTHTISAELISKSGKVLAGSNPHSFHVQRHSILNQNAGSNAPATAPVPPTPRSRGFGPRPFRR